MSFRILALDIDGTILDPYGKLTDSVREAIAGARRRGLWVVLCTGRRFRTALPWARELGLDGAIVVHNGAIIKDIDSAQTLSHAYLPAAEIPDVLRFLRRAGSPMLYIDDYHAGRDILIETASTPHTFQREYLDQQAGYFHAVTDLDAHSDSDVIMISIMAEEPTVFELREVAAREFGRRIMTHTLLNKNYQGGILEFLSPGSGKWAALARLAAEHGISAEQIVAIGDDTNDIEMIRGAGLGIAMGNANEAVKSAANWVARSNAEGGAGEAIERALLLVD